MHQWTLGFYTKLTQVVEGIKMPGYADIQKTVVVAAKHVSTIDTSTTLTPTSTPVVHSSKPNQSKGGRS